MPGEFQRWNTHHSHIVPIDVCGQPLNIAQDPSSDNLGTTIWDASVILVRYMERNPHLYSRRKLEGKRVLELGAGCGLAGMYFALQGAHVTFTDLAEVVPLLRRNVTMNLGGKAANIYDNCHGGRQNESKGAAASKRPQIEVLDYCWGDSLDALSPPYDYVVACDCVYAERLVDSLVWSLTRVSARSTTVIIASEKREEITYAKFRARLGEVFTVRQAPRRHMDAAYDHDMSEVLLCKLRRTTAGGMGTGNRVSLPEDGDGQTATGGGCTREHPIVPKGKIRGHSLEMAKGESSETATIQGEAVESGRHSVLKTDTMASKEQSLTSFDADETPDAKPRADLLEGVAVESVADGPERLSLARVSLATPPDEGNRRDLRESDLRDAVTSAAGGNGAR